MNGSTLAIHTLGCKLNFTEGSAIGRQLQEEGFELVDFQQAADLYVVNTCSVTDNADKKCRHIIRKALDQNPEAFIVVIGCYAQLKPKEISEIPGVDLVLGAAEKFNLVKHLSDLTKKEAGTFVSSEVCDANVFINSWSDDERTRAFLKVQDGCDYSCSFCTIPLARGKSRSNSIEGVLKNVEEIVAAGKKEIILTGVNLGDFGANMPGEAYSFHDLAQELDKVEGIERFRISSIEPNLLTDPIIELVAASNKFVPHFHIPLQSGNNRLLALMRRRYKRELYSDRIRKIKTLMPHCCIGVDVIVGFPTETEEDFLETYNFLNDLPVSYLHVFTYSERANTKALEFEEVVPVADRKRRSKMLRILSEKKKRFFYEQHKGERRSVLLESKVVDGRMQGFTDNYIAVSVPFEEGLVNKIVSVDLGEIGTNGMYWSDCLKNSLQAH